MSSLLKGLSRSVSKVVTTQRQVEGAGFVVRRSIGTGDLSYVDPFLMLDHFGPIDFKPGEAVLAPDHPHRGIETVTYMLQGSVEHLDSKGNHGKIETGAVQYMSAGSGVLHSEMPSDEFQQTGGTMEGMQLWVNMPAAKKFSEPRYQDIKPSSFPTAHIKRRDGQGGAGDSEEDSVLVKIIAGEVSDGSGVHRSSINTYIPLTLLDIQFKHAGATFTHPIPENYNGWAYVFRGVGEFGSNKKTAKEGQIVVMGGGGNEFTITSLSQDGAGDDQLRVLLGAAVPLNEPVARAGPFVLNTQEQLRQAFTDYQQGKFGEMEGAQERHRKAQAALKKSGGPIAAPTKHY